MKSFFCFSHFANHSKSERACDMPSPVATQRGMELLALCFILIHAHLLHVSHAGTPATLHPPCELTLGGWCQAYQEQRPQATRMPPEGSKTCPGLCSGVGTCDADTGTCVCPAGWTGPDCRGKRQRPVSCSTHGMGCELPCSSSQLGPFGLWCVGTWITTQL